MADRCNISNYFLRDTKRKLAIPLPQRNVTAATTTTRAHFNGFFLLLFAGGGEGGEGVRVGREAKNTSKNAIDTDKQKNKRKKLREKKNDSFAV